MLPEIKIIIKDNWQVVKTDRVLISWYLSSIITLIKISIQIINICGRVQLMAGWGPGKQTAVRGGREQELGTLKNPINNKWLCLLQESSGPGSSQALLIADQQQVCLIWRTQFFFGLSTYCSDTVELLKAGVSWYVFLDDVIQFCAVICSLET